MIPSIYFDKIADEELYNTFFKKSGCFILKNVFDENTMNDYNKWCIGQKDIVIKNHKNIQHPKQKGKFVINDILERMSSTNPELLLKLVNNKKINYVSDVLLGFHRFGAVTTHWLEPNGDRQKSHTDYPCHVGSGLFWENNPNLLNKYFTDHMINQVLPHYSIQVLIASDKMGKFNGSTEVIPGSHLIKDVDKKILQKNFYESVDKKFINTSLEKGDVLFFNRRLIHRGGKNISNNRRNSLIMQKVWMFGLGQHKINSKLIIDNLKKCNSYNNMKENEKKDFNLRLNHPYPIDTTINN